MKKKNNREPIYALIYTNLRNQIFNGQLSAGDLLPSENQLSSNYKVSRETVRRGLKALESEGLIYSRPKVGYFVSLPNYSDVTVSFTVNPTDCRTHYKDIHAVMVPYFNDASELFITRDLQRDDRYTLYAPVFEGGDAGLDAVVTAAQKDDAYYNDISQMYTQLPNHMEQKVFDDVKSIVAGESTPYGKAMELLRNCKPIASVNFCVLLM